MSAAPLIPSWAAGRKRNPEGGRQQFHLKKTQLTPHAQTPPCDLRGVKPPHHTDMWQLQA